jgi:hypothetical protein
VEGLVIFLTCQEGGLNNFFKKFSMKDFVTNIMMTISKLSENSIKKLYIFRSIKVMNSVKLYVPTTENILFWWWLSFHRRYYWIQNIASYFILHTFTWDL